MLRGSRISYGLKNFQRHMGINSNITLGGLIKRSVRRYPRAYNFIKKGSLLCGIYLVMMSITPGTSLPLQKPIKISLLAFTRLTAQLWYYNLLTPQPEQYLIKLNEIILTGIEGQIYDVSFLEQYFTEIRQLMEEEKKQMKQSAYLDLLLYSEIILQNIIRYQKRFLLEEQIYYYYSWVCATVFDRVNTITEKESKHVKLAYSIVQYLINFAPEGREQEIIKTYHRLTTKKNVSKQNQNSFARKIMKLGIQETQFTSALKKIYSKTQSVQLKQQILQIFQALNQIYEEKIKQS